VTPFIEKLREFASRVERERVPTLFEKILENQLMPLLFDQIPDLSHSFEMTIYP